MRSNNNKHLLVIRLSSAGDVAMTIPVLQSLLVNFPSTSVSILTKKQFAPLFENIKVSIIVAETDGIHKGFIGVLKLCKQIRKEYRVNAVADLHNVLRSKVIRIFFWLSGSQIAFIDKGRKKLKKLTRKEGKELTQLPSRFELYLNVFNRLGFQFPLAFKSIYDQCPELNEDILKITGQKSQKWIGIAPFAAYQSKIYPTVKMKQLIEYFASRFSVKILLFGGGKVETEIFNNWQLEFVNSINVSEKLDLRNELILMANLDCMIAMDSANMHFASIVNIPVISIWGATHPFAGFAPWGQPSTNEVSIDMYCRPCSVYGNIPCYRGDHACMNLLPASLIAEKLTSYVS